VARFDVYTAATTPHLLLDVQADLLSDFATRIVVPLILAEEAPKPARRLNPEFSIGGHYYIMVTQFIAAVQVNELREKVTDLSAHRDRILIALDMAFTGY
jgi:toxin CcdB